MDPDINEVLNFLAHYAAEDLAPLRRAHPQYADTLLPNHFGVTDKALEVGFKGSDSTGHALLNASAFR